MSKDNENEKVYIFDCPESLKLEKLDE